MLTSTRQPHRTVREAPLDRRLVSTVDIVPDTLSTRPRVPRWSRTALNAFPLLVADLAALGVAMALAFALENWFSVDVTGSVGWPLILAGVILPLTFALFGLYPGTGLNAVAELTQVAVATTLLFSVLLVSAQIDGIGRAGTLALIVACVLLPAAVSLFRALARTSVSRFRWWGQPVLVVGSGATAQHLYNYYRSHPGLGIRPVAIIGPRSAQAPSDGTDRDYVLPDGVERLRRQHDISWAVVATPLTASSAAAVRSYLATFPHVLIVPDTEGLPSIRHQMFDCGNLTGIPMTNSLLLAGPRIVKKLMDYALVICGGIVCLPLVAVIAILIKLTSSGPVFYAQSRIGKGQRNFRAWKFRTMVVDADEVLEACLEADPALRDEWERDHKLKNDPRVTAVGRWLRKTSLDELPQIWNVLRGEMSLVGPRPIVTAEIPKYGDWFELYGKVTPGITGLWQISGRNNTTYERRVAIDSYYVLNWSPWLDLYILARTINVVLRHEGAY